MAIVGSGYDRDVGGAQGTGYQGLDYMTSYGVDVSTWMSWNRRQQELWIQNVNRTDAQQDYSTDSDYAKVYDIKNTADEMIVNPIIDGTQQTYKDIKGAAQVSTELLFALGAILLLRSVR